MSDAAKYIESLIKRAKEAQKSIEFASQETVDAVVESMAWHSVQPAFARELAELAVTESRMGDVDSK